MNRDFLLSNKNVRDLLMDIYWATSDQFCGEMSDDLWQRIEKFSKAEMAARCASDLADAGGTDYMSGAPTRARPSGSQD